MRHRCWGVLGCFGVLVPAMILISGYGWADQDGPSREPSEVEQVVQRQLDAYNRRDLDGFLETYAEEVTLSNFPDDVLSTGIEAMRERYGAFFGRTPDLHAAITQRIVRGDYVIDHERVRADGREFQAVAIYQVKDGKIQHVWFMR